MDTHSAHLGGVVREEQTVTSLIDLCVSQDACYPAQEPQLTAVVFVNGQQPSNHTAVSYSSLLWQLDLWRGKRQELGVVDCFDFLHVSHVQMPHRCM